MGPSTEAAWQPRAYLLKCSPAAGGLLKKFAWQKRWFEVSDHDFRWFPNHQSASAGAEPLGRVPLSMVVTARPSNDGFEVDLGNRILKLALESAVPKAQRDVHVRNWIDALCNVQVNPARLPACLNAPHVSAEALMCDVARLGRRRGRGQGSWHGHGHGRALRMCRVYHESTAWRGRVQVVGEVQDESCSHKKKFWKPTAK